MDVKEINNNMLPFMFGKTAANSSSEALGAGFAALLGQTGSALELLPAVGEENASAAVKSASANSANRSENIKEYRAETDNTRDRRSLAKEARAEKKGAPKAAADNAKESAKKSKETTRGESAEGIALQNQPVPEARQPESPVPAVAVEAPLSEPGVAVDSPLAEEISGDTLAVQPAAENGQPIIKELSVTLLSSLDANASIVATVDNGAFTIFPEAFDLSALASMESVGVLDAATGEVAIMTGAEFVEKLQSASAQGQLYIPGKIEGKFVELLPAEIVKELGTQSAKAASADTPAAVQSVVYEDENLAAQAAILDDKLEGKAKIKVSVENREEKITYTSTGGAIKDRVTLEEALKAFQASADAESEGGDERLTSTAASALSPKNTPVAPGAAAALNGAAVAATAIQPLEAQIVEASSVKLSAVAETSSAAAQTAAAGSGEFIAQAKAEAVAKTNDASFRDIYKGMSKEVIDQVKVNITKSAIKGIDKIDISLKPEDLGHIEVKMQISKDGKLSAHIIASRPETMDILQKDMQSLQKAFNDAGFQTDDSSLSFSFREDGQAGYEQNRESELRSFIGDVFASEAGEDLAGNDNLSNWVPASGLNIRV